MVKRVFRKDALGTTNRIIDVAESMFAEHGYRGVSIRSITRESKANNASIHYHFGSKEALLREIFRRRSSELNAERLRLLAICQSSLTTPAVEDILQAFLRPSFLVPNGNEGARRFMRLRAVLLQEETKLARELMTEHFDEVSRTFVTALGKVLPGLSDVELFWRFHFLIGAMYWSVAATDRIRDLSKGSCDPSQVNWVIDEITKFLAAGFRAPSRAVEGIIDQRRAAGRLAEAPR